VPRAAGATLAALVALSACRAPEAPPPATPPANVLLVTVDTLRADRLGRGFTPTLDRLASGGLRFTHARSVVPLTLPAHVSIMTGLLPPRHGARLNGAARLANADTLASRLKSAGYQTRAVVGAFVLDRRFGLDAGFDEYDDRVGRDPDATDRLQAERPADEVVDRALALLSATSATSPWFLWAHVYDPHAPYRPPDDARARAGGDAYNGEVAFVDTQVGRLLAAVEARPDASRTAVIVAGDHGESLGAHGEATHGMLVFEPALRVPLIVRAPGVAAAERADPATLIDVAPTILTMAGQTVGDLPGRNLLAASDADAESYAESDYPTVAAWTPLKALVRDRWKVVVADRPALYDMTADPDEQRDLAAERQDLAAAMAARIEEIRKAATNAAPSTSAISPDTAARLRSLGYVASPRASVSPEKGVNPATAMRAWTAFEAALAEVNDGQVANALPALARVAAEYPASPVFESTYGRALAASGRRREALARFQRAVARWPGDWSMYHELAVVARDLGEHAEAMRAEEAALVLDGSQPSVLNGKGLLLADADRHADAAQAFESASRLDPTNAVYHANIGNARRAAGDLDGAAAAYHLALDLEPRLPDAANGLGVVLVQQRRPAEAVAWLEQAAQDPAFVEAQLNLGIALQEAGDPDRARRQYKKVLAAAGSRARERDAARALLAQLDGR
jgi:arylsulfatase A-like enzyme/Flp pilus assembly protein TadD